MKNIKVEIFILKDMNKKEPSKTIEYWKMREVQKNKKLNNQHYQTEYSYYQWKIVFLKKWISVKNNNYTFLKDNQ